MNKNLCVTKLLTLYMNMLSPSFSAQDYIHCITFPQQLVRRTSKLIHISLFTQPPASHSLRNYYFLTTNGKGQHITTSTI